MYSRLVRLGSLRPPMYPVFLSLLGLIEVFELKVHSPELQQVSPTSADITGGTKLVLTVASIHPDSIATDVTVVFQQKTERKCELLQYNTDSGVWYCQVTVPISAGLIVSTGSDPSGIGIYTAQLGKPKSVFFQFHIFLSKSSPVAVALRSRSYIQCICDGYIQQLLRSALNIAVCSELRILYTD
jgi:hypothetical protein